MQNNEQQDILKVIKKLPRYTKLVYRLYKAPYITRRQKLLLSTALGYLISPIELVPGFIPVVGQVDDLVIILTILKRVLKSSKDRAVIGLLHSSGLTLEGIDEDIQISLRTAKGMVMKFGQYMGKTVMWTGKTGVAAGRRILGKLSKENSEDEKES